MNRFQGVKRLSGTRLKISLHPAELDALRSAADLRQISPAMLATRYVQKGLAREQEGNALLRPSARLLEWLRPQLDALRDAGDWPADITIGLFGRIEAEVLDLYEAAADELGRQPLNQELGRFIREGLRARPVMRDGKPHFKKLGKARQSLVTGATLLEPAT